MNFDFLKAAIVPCGLGPAADAGFKACTVCDFFVLLQNIINFFLYLMIPLVTLAAVYIAFIFMTSGGSSSKITDAKGKAWLVLLGIFWVLGSWLVLNTILNIVAKPGVFPWPWNQINCQASQPAANTTGSPSVETPVDTSGFMSVDRDPVDAIARLDQASQTGEVYADGVQTNTPGYMSVDTEHDGLEQVEPATPYSSAQVENPAIDAMVKQADVNGVDPNLVKAVIQAESSGNKNAIHVDKDGKASYGLMQVRTDTAKRYDSTLANLSDAQIGEKLKDPDYNMEIGTAYLQDLSVKYKGDLDKVIAAYNGGPGANKPSVDCPGSMRWQCQWDNTAQTVPNTGYAVTRNYVVKVNNYYSQLSK
ncbi:MAG: lytic transglycosylase domain-containing protein [Candidatus Azambacteria bacterium]|nr:lytic transglycosylase domain-containing protein [Candidatus Azambacteria bacterium]